MIGIANDGLEASLERFKLHRRLPASADDSPLLRVVDACGEDYLFNSERFVEVQLPSQVASLMMPAAVIPFDPRPARVPSAGAASPGLSPDTAT